MADPVYVLRGHALPVHAVAFSDDGLRVYTGDAGGTVLEWDVASKAFAVVCPATNQSVLGLVATRGLLLSHARDSVVRVWRTRAVFDASAGPEDAGVAFALDALSFCRIAAAREPAGRLLCAGATLEEASAMRGSAHFPGAVELWDAERGRLVACGIGLAGPRGQAAPCGAPMALALRLAEDRAAATVLVGHESGELLMWLVATDQQPSSAAPTLAARVRVFDEAPVLALAVHPAQPYVLAGSPGAELVRLALQQHQPKRGLLARTASVDVGCGGVAAIDVRADGKLAVAAGWDGRLAVVGLGPPRLLAALAGHREGLLAAACSPVGNLVASASKDTRVALWQLY